MDQDLNVEEIIAEEDETGLFTSLIAAVAGTISAYGWYILAAGIGLYYLWNNYRPTANQSSKQLNPKDLSDFQKKEENRQKYVAKLQEKYEKEAEARAEKLKKMEEEKKAARLAELEKLTSGIHVLGHGNENKNKPKSKQSFRPEYNPLMGDTSSSRACSRPSGGRAGG